MTSKDAPCGLVVLACGNPSRGDDALGSLLMERAERFCVANLSSVELVTVFQLQIENALDLRGKPLCLFVDASVSAPAPYSFARVFPADDRSHTTHALSPAAVLDVYRRVERQAPPPAFVLAVRGHAFELGEALSADAALNLEAAWGFLQQLLREPTLAAWSARASEISAPASPQLARTP